MPTNCLPPVLYQIATTPHWPKRPTEKTNILEAAMKMINSAQTFQIYLLDFGAHDPTKRIIPPCHAGQSGFVLVTPAATHTPAHFNDRRSG